MWCRNTLTRRLRFNFDLTFTRRRMSFINFIVGGTWRPFLLNENNISKWQFHMFFSSLFENFRILRKWLWSEPLAVSLDFRSMVKNRRQPDVRIEWSGLSGLWSYELVQNKRGRNLRLNLIHHSGWYSQGFLGFWNFPQKTKLILRKNGDFRVMRGYIRINKG